MIDYQLHNFCNIFFSENFRLQTQAYSKHSINVLACFNGSRVARFLLGWVWNKRGEIAMQRIVILSLLLSIILGGCASMQVNVVPVNIPGEMPAGGTAMVKPTDSRHPAKELMAGPACLVKPEAAAQSLVTYYPNSSSSGDWEQEVVVNFLWISKPFYCLQP